MTSLKHNLFVDVLSILPDELECYIQAPSLRNSFIIGLLSNSTFDYYKLLKIDSTNRNDILMQEVDSNFSIYIQHILIKKDQVQMFEGFDGIEFGYISKSIVIPSWFNEKYIPDDCSISQLW